MYTYLKLQWGVLSVISEYEWYVYFGGRKKSVEDITWIIVFEQLWFAKEGVGRMVLLIGGLDMGIENGLVYVCRCTDTRVYYSLVGCVTHARAHAHKTKHAWTQIIQSFVLGKSVALNIFPHLFLI